LVEGDGLEPAGLDEAGGEAGFPAGGEAGFAAGVACFALPVFSAFGCFDAVDRCCCCSAAAARRARKRLRPPRALLPLLVPAPFAVCPPFGGAALVGFGPGGAPSPPDLLRPAFSSSIS